MDFLLKPIMKSKPIKKKVALPLISLVFVFSMALSTWGSPVLSQEYEPEDDYIHTPSESEESEPYPLPEPTLRPTPEPVEIFDDTPLNPLTGLPMDEEKIRNRPLAIVLSNEPAALPMNGVTDADIIFEMPAEGGMSRMLALYQDFTGVEMVGSIRSARHYTANVAESFDAIFIHAGGSPQAYREIRNRGLTYLDEVSGHNREIFFRTRTRIPGRRLDLLHGVVTTGERVELEFPEYDFRMVHEEDFEQGLIFVDDGTPAGGARAVEVVARFSSGKHSTFFYNEEKRVYYMRQTWPHQNINIEFSDANDNSLAGFTNILILQTSVRVIAGDETGRLNVITVGEGEGYFVSGGRYIEINWSRADLESPFVYTLRDGTPLELGRGRTFIGIIPNNMSASFS